VLAGTVGIWFGGCSSLDIEAARRLADNGTKAATTVHDDSLQAQQHTAQAVDSIALSKFLANPKGSHTAVIDELDKEYATLQQLLALRTTMYGELESVYVSFGDLVRFDVAAEMKNAADNFIGSANNFIKVIDTVSGATPIGAISAGAEKITQTGFTILGEEAQKRRVANASEVIRGAVERVAAAMAAEKVYAVSVRKGLALQRQTLLTELERHDLVSIEPLVAQAATQVGTEPAKDVGKRLSSDPALRNAFIAWQRRLFDRKVAAVEQNYEAQIGLLTALVAEHKKLEEGQPIDLAMIEAWIGRLVQLQAALAKS